MALSSVLHPYYIYFGVGSVRVVTLWTQADLELIIEAGLKLTVILLPQHS